MADWHTGLAIGGYDPVAFYTDGKPVARQPGHRIALCRRDLAFQQHRQSRGFAARPDIYMPQFGGYDPIGVARGVAVAGNPTLWLITSGRLFLFYDRRRLEMFTADPARFTGEAERKWPDVLRTLSP